MFTHSARPRNRTKSRSGCLRCKQRRIKCDEKRPGCLQCSRRRFECPGYVRNVRWSDKHQVGNAESGIALNRSDTGLDPSSEWFDKEAKSVQDALLLDSRRFPELHPTAERIVDLQRIDCTAPGSRRSSTQYSGSHGINTIANDVVNLTAEDESSFPQGDPESSAEKDNVMSSNIGLGNTWDTALTGSNMLSGSGNGSPPHLPGPSFQLLLDQSTTLSEHYFGHVCPIISCFDSLQNPFRSVLGNLMATNALIFHCVMAISAAHASQRKLEMVNMALEHRTEAISCLSMELALPTSAVTPESLLGIIVLGISSAWQDPSSLGLMHLVGGRILFKAWLVGAQQRKASLQEDTSSEILDLFIGLMAYWEALASFIVDQELSTADYLLQLCQEQNARAVFSNPWTGFSTPLFFYLAQAGTLARQKSLLQRVLVYESCTDRDTLLARLLKEASKLAETVRQYNFPADNRVNHPGDDLTPLSHFRGLARVYKSTILLQLYIAFPELLDVANADPPASISTCTSSGRGNRYTFSIIVSMAITILNVVSSIPGSSGVNVSFALPLLIAGSALQQIPATGSRSSLQTIVESEILESWTEESSVLHWRSFVRSRMELIYRRIGLRPVQHVSELLECVWMRADISNACHAGSSCQRMVHWVDVMMAERLETLFG